MKQIQTARIENNWSASAAFKCAGMLALALAAALGATRAGAEGQREFRLGYFPNVTHAPALVGVAEGRFAKALGQDVKLSTTTFNAGPSVIEAIFANHLDVAYIGPSPTLNGFLQSRGKEVRVVAGAVTNGVLIVANAKRGFKSLEELRGKRIATPQLGNTQDISAKYFVVHDLKTKLRERGGDTEVIPIANPDIESLFVKDQLDAAWVPEPWGSRLVEKGLVTVLAHERDLWPEKSFVLTNVIVRKEFLEKNREDVRKFLAEHAAIVAELDADRNKFAPVIGAELKRLTSVELPEPVLKSSLANVGFTVDPNRASFQKFFEMGRELRLIKFDTLDLNALIDTSLLPKGEGTAK